MQLAEQHRHSPLNRDQITPELLREFFVCDPYLTGQLWWKPRGREWFPCERSWKSWNSRFAGRLALTSPDRHGYPRGKILHHRFFTHRTIWAHTFGVWPDQIDHINGHRSDNRISNMRDVSHAENQKNRKRHTNNKSGVVGVVWHIRDKLWHTQIKHQSRQIHLGTYPDIETAKAVRKWAEASFGYHANHGRIQ